MEILSQYLEQRKILSSKLDSLLLMPYSKRSQRMVEVLTDEICELDFAIAEMQKAIGSFRCLGSQRDIVLNRIAYYQSFE